VAAHKQTAPARGAPSILFPDRTLAVKGGQVWTAALGEVLAEVVQGIAAVALLTWARGELGGVGDRVAETLGIREGAEFTVLVLASSPLLLVAFPVPLGLLDGVLGIGSGASLGVVVVIVTINLGLAGGKNEISGKGSVGVLEEISCKGAYPTLA
jgi:hypothetical protein